MVSVKTDFHLKKGSYLKSETSIDIRIEFLLFWYLVEVCSVGPIPAEKFWFDWGGIFNLENQELITFAVINFFTFASVTPSIFNLQKSNIYQILANVMEIPQNQAVYW